MKKISKNKFSFKPCYLAVLAFLTSFAFFLFAYPYHLIRREQLTLFLYDWDYICQTYAGTGWLARFVSDFLVQFFLLPVIGPLIVALLLTAIGSAAYSICRKFIGVWPSLAIATVIIFWSFMRETGNLYTTRYTLVILGYLAIILAALQFKKYIYRAFSFALMFIFGLWAIGSPYHENYGKLWSSPKLDYERLIALDAESARENWDKVIKLSNKDLFMMEASYYYNLAHAVKGDLGEMLLAHSQGHAYELLLRVTSEQSVFTNCIAGEAWYHLGSLSIAEQSAITTMQASPNHTGARFIKRLADISLITGNDTGARKYLGLLSKTLFYGKWAKNAMPGHQDSATQAWIARERSKIDDVDFVHLGDVPRSVLKGLLDKNPENTIAQNYLLCYDLMRYDLDQFMEDYSVNMINARLYREAVLIWLSQQDRLNEETATSYGVSESDVTRMNSFGRNPERHRNTYWYYYLSALNRSAQ